MKEVLKLRQLVDYGIPISLLARECHCSQSAIYKYLNGDSLPSGSKIIGIKDGLEHIFNTIIAIIKE